MQWVRDDRAMPTAGHDDGDALHPTALALTALIDGPAGVERVLAQTTAVHLRAELLRRALADATAATTHGGGQAAQWLIDRAGGDVRAAIIRGFTRSQVRRTLVEAARIERVDRHEQIRQLRTQGLALAAIARKVGCSLGQVRTVIERAEWEGQVPRLTTVTRSNGVRSPARYPSG